MAPVSKVKIAKDEQSDASTLGEKPDIEKQAPKSSSDTKKDAPSSDKSGDLAHMMSGIVSGIPIKMSIMIFIVFILINSTIFIEYCIEPLGKKYYDAGNFTNMGTYLQGLFLVVGYMIIYGLSSAGVI